MTILYILSRLMETRLFYTGHYWHHTQNVKPDLQSKIIGRHPPNTASDMYSRLMVNSVNTDVISGSQSSDFHKFQHLHLFSPKILEVLSQPVRAQKIGRARQGLSTNLAAILHTSQYVSSLSVEYISAQMVELLSFRMFEAKEICNTRTLVSFVCKMTGENPCGTISLTCQTTQGSASSDTQFVIALNSIQYSIFILTSTLSLKVTITWFLELLSILVFVIIKEAKLHIRGKRCVIVSQSLFEYLSLYQSKSDLLMCL